MREEVHSDIPKSKLDIDYEFLIMPL